MIPRRRFWPVAIAGALVFVNSDALTIYFLKTEQLDPNILQFLMPLVVATKGLYGYWFWGWAWRVVAEVDEIRSTIEFTRQVVQREGLRERIIRHFRKTFHRVKHPKGIWRMVQLGGAIAIVPIALHPIPGGRGPILTGAAAIRWRLGFVTVLTCAVIRAFYLVKYSDHVEQWIRKFF